MKRKRYTAYGYLTNRWKQVAASSRNMMKLMTGSRFADAHETPYDVVWTDGFVKLRHYEPLTGVLENRQGPLLLVPPLMVTAQIYDISPILSAIGALRAARADVWLCDFGRPETEAGGMERTLDDHLLAIDQCVDFVRETRGCDVHLAGYSQGGLFVYKVAAYRRSQGIRTIITFGSPVDFQRNIPAKVDRDLFRNTLGGIRDALSRPLLDDLTGVSGRFTSLAFKLASPLKELKHLRLIVGALGDYELMSQLEPTRRFLAGEGFVAWPGPAFRRFVDDVVVENRMMVGGIVGGGRTVSLGDIQIPILYFLGENDQFARPRSVRAVARVASSEEIYERVLPVGHFGLVVGNRAMQQVWPLVGQWMAWRDGFGRQPRGLNRAGDGTPSKAQQNALADEGLSTLIRDIVEDGWDRTGELFRDASTSLRWIRWQLPHMLRLLKLGHNPKASFASLLAEQAIRSPLQTFVLWEGRAHTYAEFDVSVTRLASGLYACGIVAGDHVAIVMDNHPHYLHLVGAISRLGAVAVLVNSGVRSDSLVHALGVVEVRLIVVDLAHFGEVREVADGGRVLLLADGGKGVESSMVTLDSLCANVPETTLSGVPLNVGRHDDLAMLIFTSGTTGLPKAARITNARWLLGASGASIGSSLTAADTVYCALPLYHASGMILAAGGALLAGCRLALAPRFSISGFWDDVRRTGATVVVYVGELCRYLVALPETESERNHSIRVFLGNGMRSDVWRQLTRRFGRVRVFEFYASTEGNLVLANISGEKVGSVGRVPFGMATVELVRYDVGNEVYLRDEDGFLLPSKDEEPGMLIGAIDARNPMSRFDGYTEGGATEGKILRSVFVEGDSWFATGDMLRRDAEGDFWFVDRVGDTFRWKGENVSTEEVDRVLAKDPSIALSCVYGAEVGSREGRAGMAALQLQKGKRFSGKRLFRLVERHLAPAARPRFIRIVKCLETTGSLKIVKYRLREEGISALALCDPIYWRNAKRRTYSLMTPGDIGEIMERV